MVRYFLIAIGIIILYKLIFDFIIPVFRTTRRIRKQFRDINQQMHDRMNQYQEPQPPPSQSKPKKESKDYIDFEEIK